MPARNGSGSRPFGPASTASRQRIRTWIALSATPPYIPEWRSRSPVVTLTSKPTRPRVASSIVGHVALQHPAVEDHARVRAALVLRDPVDDRVAADLLLAVEREAEIDRQRVRLDEPLRGLEHEQELALVVGDAARVRPLAADLELERVGLPEVERRGRLDVEVVVDEDGRRVAGAVGGRDLAEHELALAERRQLGGAADFGG